MKYSDVESELHSLIANSSPEDKRAFAIEAIHRIARLEGLEEVVKNELDADGAAALWAAMRSPEALSAESVSTYLEQIDNGDLTDGELDSTLLWAVTALESWGDFLDSRDDASIATIAITLLEIADFEIDGAALDDFLADPRMRRQFDAIAERLSGRAATTS